MMAFSSAMDLEPFNSTCLPSMGLAFRKEIKSDVVSKAFTLAHVEAEEEKRGPTVSTSTPESMARFKISSCAALA